MTIKNLHITKLSHEGRGIAHLEGKAQFVDNALPGEDVTAKTTKKHQRYDENITVSIETASPARAEPPCPYFMICGGCRLQHLSATAQIAFKQEQLVELLTHFGNCQPEAWLPALQTETLGYRRKARLGVKFVKAKNKVIVGFREMNGRYLANIDACVVLQPRLSQLIQLFSNLIISLSNFQAIPQLEIAMGDEEIAVIVRHLEPFTNEDLEALINFAKAQQIQLYLQPKGPDSIHKLCPKDSQERLHYALPAHQLRFAFYPTDFTQVNLSMNRLMIDQALQLLELKKTDHVLDLFCGIGNFSLPLARYSQFVLGVEGDHTMVKRAFENAQLNHIANVNFVAADLTKEFEFAKGLQINKVLLDPPRSGAIEVLPHVIALKPERIVYVSCNPSTLARDAKLLIESGYALKTAGVMDMFPHTAHVESMALFERELCHQLCC